MKDQARLRITIRGAVQGVGFRPFIYRLAVEMGLTGWVSNFPGGVWIEVEGDREKLEKFLLRIEPEKPPNSAIQGLESSFLDTVGYSKFEIRAGRGGFETRPYGGQEKTTWVLPDIATCADCLIDLFDPGNRRYHYPFTNCTHCGPRFSIIETIPYDRHNTTMKKFVMCDLCQREYDDPKDRRFHAQPNACPACGPRLELWNNKGDVLVGAGLKPAPTAIIETVTAIRRGFIIAIKGIGGFHLMVDARNEEAVGRLRQRKHREEKPFALMFPSMEMVKEYCEVSPLEERLLTSPEAPIVLLKRKNGDGSDFSVGAGFKPAPTGNPYLGVMLPYTPLHHLLMKELGFPVVATSGNLTDEPICIDEREALKRLGGIADFFLVYNRPIIRPIDDSIVRVMMGREMVLRRARGYAPLPVHVGAGFKPAPTQTKGDCPDGTILAVGAHLKNTIAISVGNDVFISQHIGDLETPQALQSFHKTITDLSQLYECKTTMIAHDLHPDYLSTQFARRGTACRAPTMQFPARPIGVQHHYAHVLSCMAENELIVGAHCNVPLLGVAWDGTGYGTDGTIWGGEFLRVGAGFKPAPTEGAHTGASLQFDRFAHFRTFRLPGGEKGVKEPRRSALGLLYEIFGDAVFSNVGAGFKPAPTEGAHTGVLLHNFSIEERGILRAMLRQNINTPITSSAGRLFDAVASILGIRQQTKFEGQAAMELEFAAEGVETDDVYPVRIRNNVGAGLKPAPTPESPFIIDWAPMILAILKDIADKISVGMISAKFHNTLAEMIVEVARHSGQERVVLTGGCFQNRYLTERSVKRLMEEGFRPYWHQRVPPNDGGIALGQVVAGMLKAENGKWRMEKDNVFSGSR